MLTAIGDADRRTAGMRRGRDCATRTPSACRPGIRTRDQAFIGPLRGSGAKMAAPRDAALLREEVREPRLRSRASACGQRVRKWQPDGGSIGWAVRRLAAAGAVRRLARGARNRRQKHARVGMGAARRNTAAVGPVSTNTAQDTMNGRSGRRWANDREVMRDEDHDSAGAARSPPEDSAICAWNATTSRADTGSSARSRRDRARSRGQCLPAGIARRRSSWRKPVEKMRVSKARSAAQAFRHPVGKLRRGTASCSFPDGSATGPSATSCGLSEAKGSGQIIWTRWRIA